MEKELHFRDAEDALRALEPRIVASGYVELEEQLRRAVEGVRAAEADYADKIERGYKVLDGRLVSPEEQQEALARQRREKEEARQRAEAEQQRRVDERKRAEEARRKEQEARRLADEKRELGAWASLHRLESGTIKHIGDVDVVLGYRFSTVYVPLNAADLMSNKSDFRIFFPVGYRVPGEPFTDAPAGFIPVHGKPEKIEIASSDDTIVKVYDDGSAGFRGGGEVRVTVRVGGDSVSASVKVVQLPVNAARFPKRASSAEDVIRSLGLPDAKKEHYISWPNSRSIDGIFYSPDAGGGIATEHWKFSEYPGMTIAIVGRASGGWVWCIGTSREGGD